MRNIGTVRAPWRFVPKLEERTVEGGRRWLSVSPRQGMLLPDEVSDAIIILIIGIIPSVVSTSTR